MRFNERKVYLVKDDNIDINDFLQNINFLKESNVRVLEYSSEIKSSSEMLKEAKLLKNMCSKEGISLMIKDRVDIAIAINADGIYLGKYDLDIDVVRSITSENKIIGISVETLEELNKAIDKKVDFIVLKKDISSREKFNGNIYNSFGDKRNIEKMYSKEKNMGIKISFNDVLLERYKEA